MKLLLYPAQALVGFSLMCSEKEMCILNLYLSLSCAWKCTAISLHAHSGIPHHLAQGGMPLNAHSWLSRS